MKLFNQSSLTNLQAFVLMDIYLPLTVMQNVSEMSPSKTAKKYHKTASRPHSASNNKSYFLVRNPTSCFHFSHWIIYKTHHIHCTYAKNNTIIKSWLTELKRKTQKNSIKTLAKQESRTIARIVVSQWKQWKWVMCSYIAENVSRCENVLHCYRWRKVWICVKAVLVN